MRLITFNKEKKTGRPLVFQYIIPNDLVDVGKKGGESLLENVFSDIKKVLRIGVGLMLKRMC